jgi:hypothetical protein
MKQSLKNEVTTILHSLPIVKNLARKKFIAAFVLALIQSRNVQFAELAQHLNPDAKLSSNETRIQDFFRETDLDYTLLAVLVLSLLPKRVKLRLCIDRTEWDFGTCQVNILMVLVGHGDVQLPLFWQFLDNKSGNSSSQDRIDLLEQCFAVLDKKRVGLVVGDREFIGQKWVKWLKDNQLPFLFRVPKHHLILDAEGQSWQVGQVASVENKAYCLTNVVVDGCSGSVWLMRLSESEYLFLFGTVEVQWMGQLYRKRWSIESCFQNLKKRGFDLEKTHLKCLEKLSKLVGLVSLTYAFCMSVGLYYHQKVQPIKKKKHGYKANSFARYGLNQLRALMKGELHQEVLLWPLLQRIIGWLKRQLTQNQAAILAG